MAADGISEFLERIAVQAAATARHYRFSNDDTLHLHATDPGPLEAGEWTVRRSRRHLVTSALEGRRGAAWAAELPAGDGAPFLGPTPASSCWGMPRYGKMAGSRIAVAAARLSDR